MKRIKTKDPKNLRLKRLLLIVLSVGIILMSCGLFLLYGPINYIRDTLITTAMTTMNHQYLCKWFYNDSTIDKVLSENVVIESGESTDTNLIQLTDFRAQTKTYANEYEKQVLEREEDELYKIIDIEGPSYRGYLVAIYDPSKVHIASTKELGVNGQTVESFSEDNGAVVAMNAGGFYDPTWMSSGGTPHGTVIKDGQVIWRYQQAAVGGGFIGFTFENKFVVSSCSEQEALAMGMRDAIQFGPFLIVNGKPSFIKGNGGWGIAPRSAIGQRADGIVLFLVIDGRQPNWSIGADLVDMTEIMQNYGAVNAANLDGGTSTTLAIEGKLYSKPSNGSRVVMRRIPNAWVVIP